MQEELDLSVFKLEFDPHKRGKTCVKNIGFIQKNEPKNGKILSPFNQKKLLEYAERLITKIKRQELSLSSFEKYTAEAYNMALFFGELDVSKVEKPDVSLWWESILKRYETGKIAFSTMRKLRECFIVFFKWLNGIEKTQYFELMVPLKVPKRPRAKLKEEMPTQADIKKLIEAAYIEGKRFSIRDRAIMAIANDTGARVSEILSMKNKHIRPEQNFLVVSFPESKTLPRTVFCFLSKPHIEEWARVSPNRDKGADAYFFCQANGKPANYPVIANALRLALKKSGIIWREQKAMHYFRAMFASRAYQWGYLQRHYWLGWHLKGIESSYTELNYKQCVEPYFKMIEAEKNPMAEPETLLWENDKDTEIKTLQERLEKMENNLAKVLRHYEPKIVAR